VYSDIGDYEKSTAFYFKSLKLAEQMSDALLVGGINYNIANNYFNAGKTKYCIEFLNKAITKIGNEKNNETILGSCYNMLGSINGNEKKYDVALDYFKKAEKLFVSTKQNDQLGNVYVEIAFMGIDKPDYKLVEEYSRKSLAVFKKENDPVGVATSYINLHMVHINDLHPASLLNKKEALISLALLDSAEFAIKEISSPETKIKIWQNKQQLYSDLKQFDSAYVYQSKSVALNDSIHGIEKNKQLDELKVQYDVDKKEQENLLLQKEKKNQYYLVIILIIVLIAIIIFSVLLFRINRLRSREKALQLEQRLLRLQMNPHFLFR
jgi:tetratricopeptide (TPR) repeat protein